MDVSKRDIHKKERRVSVMEGPGKTNCTDNLLPYSLPRKDGQVICDGGTSQNILHQQSIIKELILNHLNTKLYSNDRLVVEIIHLNKD